LNATSLLIIDDILLSTLCSNQLILIECHNT